MILSSAAVTVCEPTVSNHNPSPLSSAAAEVRDLAASNHNPSPLSSDAGKVCDLADAEGPAWELFCLEHNMHELAQDDDKSGLAPSHRPLRGVALGLFTAMVTRIIPTSSPEAKGEGCLKALLKETTKLRSRAVWDESLVEEWSAVHKQDPNASCGRVFSILGEKNAERHAPEGEREYKARIVFAGNAIQTASGVAPHELFQEVSSAPAAMASIRAVLAVSALRGWPTKARDAAQAYIQARIDNPGRPKTWVRLPKSWWPASGYSQRTASQNIGILSASFSGRCPGTPNLEPSGKHVASILEELGWERVAAHPGTWVHKETKALLAVYVDDLLMTAPPSHRMSCGRPSKRGSILSLQSSRSSWVLIMICASAAT